MAFPLSVLGVFGAAKATMDLVYAFWDGLTEEQQSEVRSFAYETGVNLNQIFQPLLTWFVRSRGIPSNYCSPFKSH